MKSKHVFSFMIVVLCLFVVTAAMAGGLELKPYGFIKGDMVYATKGVLSFGSGSLAASQRATDYDNPLIGFTAQHTRFGLKGSTGEDIKVGGKIELDFFVNANDTNGKPRIRQAFAWFKKENMEFRFGQQWDIFSPNNASTNNTNGNMWYAGNMGFRRGMIQFIYKMSGEGMVPMIQLALCEGSKESSAVGMDNLSGIPMSQGRVSAKLEDKHVFGLYFAYASFDPDPDADEDQSFSASGFGADFNLKFGDKIMLKGEANMGTNLNNANLFTIAGNFARVETTGEDVDMKNLGIWGNVIIKASEKVKVIIGGGMDKNQTDDKWLADHNIDSNIAIYGDLIYPVAHGFSITFEVESISTSYVGEDVDTDSALIFDVAGKVTF